jgi:hypothetical protein
VSEPLVTIIINSAGALLKDYQELMARRILHHVSPQHESDSRLSFRVSSSTGRAGTGKEEAQQFRGGPILRTERVQA